MTLKQAVEKIRAMQQNARHDDTDGSEKVERALLDVLALLEQVR